MKLSLAIDSSQRLSGAVALAAEGRLVAEVLHDPATGYAEAFFGMTDEALRQAEATVEQIARVAVITGPGSFTGLRIGVMTAKSLAYALRLPLFAAGTLPMLALGAVFQQKETAETVVLPLLEAGRGAAYAAVYRVVGGQRQTHREPFRLSLDELPDMIAGLDSPPRVAALGEEARAAAEKTLGPGGLIPPVSPSLASTLALAVQRDDPWCSQADPSTLLPVYLGLSQAERVHGLDLQDEVHRQRPPQRGE